MYNIKYVYMYVYVHIPTESKQVYVQTISSDDEEIEAIKT